jgi:hypothetical protein
MQTLTKQEALNQIYENDTKIFGVTFEKKDGSIREMTCRRGVVKGVTGVGMNYDPEIHNLVVVYDMALANKGVAKPFRMIPIDRLRRYKYKGVEYNIV